MFNAFLECDQIMHKKILANFTIFNTHGCTRIIALMPPRWMMKLNDKVNIIRSNGLIKNQTADTPPMSHLYPLERRQPCNATMIGHFDIKDQFALSKRKSPIINLRHDFIVKVEVIAGNTRENYCKNFELL